MAALVAEIEHEAEVARKGSEPAGVTAVLSQDPHSHPRKPKKSSVPRFHAFRNEIRLALYDAYSVFLGLFRDAAPVKSYRLIYEVSPDRVSVLAFVHSSRDLPALWQRREGTADPEA